MKAAWVALGGVLSSTAALAAKAAPRMPEAVKRQFKEWSEERPEEAAGWLASQPEDARRLIAP